MKRNIRRNNLTLLELVISLAIVAALSVVVLDNFSDVEMRERERQTVERGEQLRCAMTGVNEKDGVSRFLSDMGRWPKVTVKNGTDGERNHGRNLAQLYDRSVFYHKDEDETMFNRSAELTVDAAMLGLPAAPDFTGYAFPAVALNVGWSGPYLNVLKSDGAPFPDAWGRSWKIVEHYHLKKSSDNTLVADYTVVKEGESKPDAKTEIDGVVSYGADDAEGGAGPADRDREFIFAHDLNLATLTVTLKVRDEFDPARWNALVAGSPELYGKDNKTDYLPGDAVYTDVPGTRSFYTCVSATSNTPYKAPNDAAANAGWRSGLPAHRVSADGVSVLLFAPARREVSGNSVMEAGVFRFLPYLTGATVADRFPPLRYRHSGALHNDADATADGSVDQEVERGERNPNRLRAKSDWEYSGSSLPSTFRAEWLVPGKRRIYAFIGFYDNSTFVSGAASSVEYIDLKPGNNYVTLYLERVR